MRLRELVIDDRIYLELEIGESEEPPPAEDESENEGSGVWIGELVPDSYAS